MPGGYTFGVQADLDRVPAPYLRKNFEVGGKVKRAMVYVTALGTYELRLNGKKVGNDVLAPGWPEFRKRVHYQTYEVTGQLQPGANTIGAILGDGRVGLIIDVSQIVNLSRNGPSSDESARSERRAVA